jgi:D-psicose/D-tagatose/L-ribulose 3-epimerase
MKFSLCNEVIADRPFDEQCVFAAELGYDGLEIAPFTLGEDPRKLTNGDVSQAVRSLNAAGISATGLHWLLVKPPGLSITSRDEGICRETLEVMSRNVELCAELGGSVLVHGSPLQRALDPDEDQDAARGRAIEIFSKVAEISKICGVTYCIEPLHAGETNFVNRVEEAVDIVEKINSPALKTMIDTSSATLSDTQSVPELIRTWMPTGHIAHIQFNDRNRRAPGQGGDQFTPILAALKETEYDQVIAMEPFIYEPSRDACAAFALGYVKGIWEALQ